MIALPWEAGPVLAWRLDAEVHAATWDSGIGAEKAGGRWNPKRYHAVYCSADPATAILEVAVHKRFDTLDTVRHTLTSALILAVSDVFVVQPEDVPNAAWLAPTIPGRGQQAYGRDLLERHPFVAIPSAVSNESWNLIFNPTVARGRYRFESQRRFALDPRLNPA